MSEGPETCVLSHSVVSSFCYPMDCSSPGSSVHGDSLGNARVSCHVLLRGMFPTQGLNIGLLHCRWILYHLSHQGSPRILETVAYSFSRESFWHRNWTGVSCIADNFITSWDTREDPCKVGIQLNSLEPFLGKKKKKTRLSFPDELDTVFGNQLIIDLCIYF